MGMLQLRAPTNLPVSTQECSGMPKADALHPPNCSQGSESWMVRNTFCAQNLVWRKRGEGQVSLTSFEVQPAMLKSAWAPPGAGPTFRHHRGEKSARDARSPLLTLGERCMGRCYNLFPSELLELMNIFKCPSFASQGDWIWELPHYICMLSHTHTSSVYGGNICCKHMEKALLEASI